MKTSRKLFIAHANLCREIREMEGGLRHVSQGVLATMRSAADKMEQDAISARLEEYRLAFDSKDSVWNLDEVIPVEAK